MKALDQIEIDQVAGGIVDDVIGGHGYAGGGSGDGEGRQPVWHVDV